MEKLESRLLFTVGELVRNGAMEGTVATTDWVRGSAWQAGSLGHTNYHGGTGYAYNGTSSGSYIHNTSGAAGEMYQELTIPAGTGNPQLQFWTKITTEETSTTTAFDTMKVQVKNTSGTVLATLLTLSNLNAGSTSGPYTATGKYTLWSFPMSSYVGQTIRISLQVTTDGAKGTMFRVDDVSLAPPSPVVPGTSGQVVGYMPDYRYSLFNQIDLNLVTHLNYFSVGFASDGTLNTPSATFNSHLDTVVAAAHAKGVGVSITTGPGQPYTTMGASAAARAKLAADLKAYVVAHNLDGVDIDWEPPSSGANQVNYGLLIDELYAQLNPIGKKITAAVNPWTKEIPVDATKKMNWVNVMCYDFDFANHSTYAAATDGMNQWMYYGVAKNKLTMGTPFYGRYGTSWSDTHSKTYAGILNDYQAINGTYPSFDVDSYVDAAFNTTYFNGVTTIEKKMAFIRDNGFAGAMIWELGQDHWDASLKYDQYSLLPVINSMLRPPSWLSPGAGSLFDLVNSSFYLHAGGASIISDVSVKNPNLNFQITDLGALSVNMSGLKTLYLNTLSIAPGGKLDLKDNDLVVSSGNFAVIDALVSGGYSAAPDATKTGIISTNGQSAGNTILALFDNALVGAGDWPSGSGHAVSANAIIGKYTYFGDADLDGQVTAGDYGVLDAHLGTTPPAGKAWIMGDADMDGSVTGGDYGILDSNLNMGAAAPLAPVTAPALAIRRNDDLLK